MIVLDGYKSHFSIQFEEFYKEKNIIIFYLFVHLSYFIQLFDIGYFNILKQSYSRQFKVFIKVYINHIIKTEFFIVFKAVYFIIITISNIQGGFRGAGLMPYNPQVVLSKFDIKLQTLISIGPFFLDVDLQIFQTPYNFIKALSQSEYI